MKHDTRKTIALIIMLAVVFLTAAAAGAAPIASRNERVSEDACKRRRRTDGYFAVMTISCCKENCHIRWTGLRQDEGRVPLGSV